MADPNHQTKGRHHKDRFSLHRGGFCSAATDNRSLHANYARYILYCYPPGGMITTSKENNLLKAEDRYDKYVWVQGPSFYIMAMDLVHGCAGTVRAKSPLY